MDKIFIDNLRVFGILGIHPHEQAQRQLIRISVIAVTDITNAAASDDIRQTLNYSTLAKRIIKFVEDNRFLTIEALIETLADLVLQMDHIFQITLRVEKPNAVPLADCVGVEITRTKAD